MVSPRHRPGSAVVSHSPDREQRTGQAMALSATSAIGEGETIETYFHATGKAGETPAA